MFTQKDEPEPQMQRKYSTKTKRKTKQQQKHKGHAISFSWSHKTGPTRCENRHSIPVAATVKNMSRMSGTRLAGSCGKEQPTEGTRSESPTPHVQAVPHSAYISCLPPRFRHVIPSAGLSFHTPEVGGGAFQACGERWDSEKASRISSALRSAALQPSSTLSNAS